MIISLQIIGGLILLFAGGESLVRGAVAFARHIGIPTLIISLTIVAIGTSAPEMVVSVQAALTDHPDITLGNIFGSNIANIFLVLALSASILPLEVHSKIVKYDSPILVFLTLVFIYFCASEGVINFIEGLALMALLAGYTLFTVKTASKNKGDEIEQELPPDLSNLMAMLYIAAGVLMLAYGANILVEGASSLARLLGLTEAVIAVTLVAVGSSAPEIATCVVAACRKHPDIIVGNVVGSNLLNIMLGIGIPAIIIDIPVSKHFMQYDVWVMLVATLLMAFSIKFFSKIHRFTGMLFFGCYIVYIGSQFISI